MTKLTPPDPKRCQAEVHTYHPFVMGGSTHQVERCKRKPIYIAKERKPASDGQRGSMSLCGTCRKKLIAKHGEQFCTFRRIKS